MISIILHIKKILFSNKIKIPLGRWNVETCYKKINNKVDLANEDHCGNCNRYINNKLQNKN